MKERPIPLNTDMVRAIQDGRKTQIIMVIKPQPIIIKCTASTGYSIRWKYKKGTTLVDTSLPFSEIINALVWRCPYGQVGDRFWVRETYSLDWWHAASMIVYKADLNQEDIERGKLYDPVMKEDTKLYWKSSMHMSKWASRIMREITKVGAKRIQDITEEEAKADGANPFLIDKLKGGIIYKMLKTYHHEFYPFVDHADKDEEVVFECPNMGFARLHHTQWREKQDPVFRIPQKEVFKYVGALNPDYKNGFRISWDSVNAKRDYGYESNPWVWPIELKVVESNG